MDTKMTPKFIHSILSRPCAILLATLIATMPAAASELQMKVTDSGYLDAQGFSVFLYNSVYHPIFVDQKNTAMELILHGQRIATNGDIRLVPTPEQWDLVATLKAKQPDKDHNRLTAQLSFPAYQMDYTLEVTAEPGGVRVSINLDKPLPEKLAGRAGFNLEFLPSIYTGKSYAVDGKQFGVIPRSPQDPMKQVLPSPGDPKKLPYQEEWDKEKGYTQPLPIVTGSNIVLAPEDPLYRVGVSSDTAPVSLYDGRNRAQNGWFVLRSLIPSGKTEGAIVWHIRPIDLPNWTRPPMIAHSQVGYAPGFQKVAVIELDLKFDAPRTAKLLRLGVDGSYQQVFEGPITTPTLWLRYQYANFDFSSVNDTGLYAIEYAGQRTDLFPIAKGVYSHTWQSTLDGFLAVEMDHVSVREGYRLWHGVSHLDDARQAPPNVEHFDDYRSGPNLDSPFKPGEHIPGLNVGGWFDAGDYDNLAEGQYQVIENLTLAYKEFGLKWDELAVDETARTVEMHRPDGVPDAVQQVKHGVLQVMAQIHSVGHPFTGIVEPTLRQYTHLGDAASNTDGRIYSEKLGPNDIDGNFSGKPDDRWAFTTKCPACNTALPPPWPPPRNRLRVGTTLSPRNASKPPSSSGTTSMPIPPPTRIEDPVDLMISVTPKHLPPHPTHSADQPALPAWPPSASGAQTLNCSSPPTAASPTNPASKNCSPPCAKASPSAAGWPFLPCPMWMRTSNASSKKLSKPTKSKSIPKWRKTHSEFLPASAPGAAPARSPTSDRACIFSTRHSRRSSAPSTPSVQPTICWARIRSRALRTFPP